MKYQGLTFPLFALLAITVTILNSGNTTGNLSGFCSSCHGSGTSVNGSLTMTGLPVAYSQGATYSLEVCLIDPGKVAAGFRVEATVGTLSGGGDTNVNGAMDRITHSGPKGFGAPGNPACWDIDWTLGSEDTSPASFIIRGNAVNGNGSNTGDNGGYLETINNIALPVDFSSFNLKKIKLDIELTWSTASEINNEKFVVQRSFDDRPFTDIAEIKGNGDSFAFNHYSYIDNDAPQGILHYRIMQVDIDGTKDYSTTKTISNTSDHKDLFAYPNPIIVSESKQLTISQTNETLYFIDANGQVLHSYLPSNNEDQISLPDDLIQGIYYLSNGNQTVPISVLR